jgi:hypothetical protein
MLMFLACIMIASSACNHREMVEKVIGSAEENLASPSDVTSLGRDDDDGKAKKWHIGGGEN